MSDRLTSAELSELLDLLRAKGVVMYERSPSTGTTKLVLGPLPPAATIHDDPPSTLSSRVGPDGRPLSAYDAVLFAATMGED